MSAILPAISAGPMPRSSSPLKVSSLIGELSPSGSADAAASGNRNTISQTATECFALIVAPVKLVCPNGYGASRTNRAVQGCRVYANAEESG